VPCNSDYMNATSHERSMTAVFQLLDELDGKPLKPRDFGNGYDPRVYNKGLTKQQCDAMVAELCRRLQAVDVSKYSLEMQMWWRDHQRADAERVQRETDAARTKKEREEALAKLTAKERKALGV
jgi:hypothetical protein